MMAEPPPPERTSSGLDANLAAALAYGLGWVSGIAVLLLERDSRFVRFHAMQSTIVFGALSALCIILRSIPLVGVLLVVLAVIPLSAVLWLILIYKAYRGERLALPIAGPIAARTIR